MALVNKVVVVTGASGTVGSGLARAFLTAGATVIAPARSADSQARVQEELDGAGPGKLHVPCADVHTREGAQTLAQFIKDKAIGQVDHVISISGGMAPAGDIRDITPKTLQEAVDAKVAGHIFLAQATVPLLREDPASSYSVITGMLGEVSMPGTALTAISNAAAYGIAVTIQGELKGKPQRVNEVRIGAIITRDNEDGNENLPGWKTYQTSRLAEVIVSKVVANQQQRDGVVRILADDLEG